MTRLTEYLLLNHIKAQDKRITALEERMSAFDDKLAELDQATNDIATELEQLRSDITAGDASAAAKLDPIVTRLRSLAADPDNPVPAPEPTA